MGKYAANTRVPVSSSQQELERILKRYGADQTLFFREKGRAVIQFRMRNRVLRFTVEVPPLETFAEKDAYSTWDSRRLRSEAEQQKAWEQEERRRWRVLLLLLKAKLEMVQDEAADFEHEFLANIVLPDNSTAAQYFIPAIADAYETGQMPDMLPGLLSAPALPKPLES